AILIETPLCPPHKTLVDKESWQEHLSAVHNHNISFKTFIVTSTFTRTLPHQQQTRSLRLARIGFEI
ncbi:MAG: hypothetical protein AAFY48_11870, partial [Bacteroidota bacterium]